jgi:signal transduction histidine kinase
MRFRLLLILLYFWCLEGYAQDRFVTVSDSLSKQLQKPISDVQRIETLSHLGYLWQNYDIQKSIIYLEKALKITQVKNLKEHERSLIMGLAFAYRLKGDFLKSIQLLQGIVSQTPLAPEDKIQPIILAFISMNYRDMGDYQNALYYQRSTIYYNKPLPSEIQSYLNDPKAYADIFERTNQLDSALHYIKIAYWRLHNTPPSPLKNEFSWNIPLIYGKIEEKKGDNKHALNLYQEGLSAALKDKYELGIQLAQCQLANYYNKHHQVDSTLFFAKNAFEKALKTPTYQVIQEAGFLLKTIYEKQRNPAKALYYYTLANAAKDSLFSSQKLHEIQNLTLNNERKSKEAELHIIEMQSRNKQFVLLAGLIVLLLIAVIVYRNFRQQKRLNAEIESLNQNLEQKVKIRTNELQQALTEVQMAFMKGQTVERKRVSADLHDEIGAALSTIAIFSDIAKRKAQNTAPELVNELDHIGLKSREMVQTMRDTIWAMNDNSPQSAWERMYIAATESLTAKGIELEWNMPDEHILPDLPFNTKRNLFLAFKEAINNIVKHSEATVVKVEGGVQNIDWGTENQLLNVQYQLSITDNGKGFNPQSIYNQGNGLRNFENRMTEIGGKFQVESSVGKGTRLIFTFSNP